MNTTALLSLGRSFTVVAAVALITACADDTPLSPNAARPGRAHLATLPGVETDGAIATLQRVTERYHRLSVAIADGFVLLHPCEVRGNEGPVGTVYVHMGRLLDGEINPESPDALIYEPEKHGGFKLVGVEFAIPQSFVAQPPSFFGTTFQNEDEFGVFALHAWVWRNNPNGLFAETNPRVSCGDA